MSISASYEGTYRGIVVQAIVGTAAVFAAVLFGYKSGRLRATPKFTKVVTFGLVGMVAVLMLNLLVGAFTSGDPLGISGGNTGLSILFTLGLIVFGALTFVLDFDQADRMVAAGVAGGGVLAGRLRPRRRADLPLPQHPATARLPAEQRLVARARPAGRHPRGGGPSAVSGAAVR